MEEIAMLHHLHLWKLKALCAVDHRGEDLHQITQAFT